MCAGASLSIMSHPSRGRRVAAVLVTLALFAASLSYASSITYLGVFPANEGEEFVVTLKVGMLKLECPDGVLVYSVQNSYGNKAGFLRVTSPAMYFMASATGMTSGVRTTYVDLMVLCDGVRTVGGVSRVYFRVYPGTTTTTPAPSFTCKNGSTLSVENNAMVKFAASNYAVGCDSPMLEIAGVTGPFSMARSLFSVERVNGSQVMIFNTKNSSVPAGNYTVVILVSCGSSACMSSQTLIVSGSKTTTTTTAPTLECPGNFNYSLALSADGTLTDQLSSVTARALATGMFCDSGTISAALRTPVHGTLRWNSSGSFKYTLETPEVGDAVDSFGFQLTCLSDGAMCSGTAVISIVPEDKDEVYYAMKGAIVCRGTCDAAAWRTRPTALDLFDVSETGVAVTPRKDVRAVDGVDFDFTVKGDLIIHAYTTIGNLAARFVTFYPLSAAGAQGFFNSSSVLDGSHVSFEPLCLDQQASTGKGADIWSWSDMTTLTGHLNTLADAYKLGDNYYQKFGGNHRHCDVYRTDPCKYAPLMTPSLNDGTNNQYNNATPSVQWKLYINDCDATWVGRASVESLRALRQPDGSPTFKLEGNGTYLVGTLYSQSVKPTSWTSPSAGIVHTETAYHLRLKIHNIITVDAVARSSGDADVPQLLMSSDIQYSTGRRTDTHERLYRYSVLLYPYFAANKTAANITTLSLKVVSTTLLNSTWTSPSKVECPMCTGTMISCTGTGDGFETDCGDRALVTFEALDYNASDFESTVVHEASSGTSASTSVSTKNALRVTFAARVNGAGSAESADAYPVGNFAMSVKLSSGQTFEFVVNQTDYISELNTRYIDTELCRPSAYWPVPDPLGSSVPVKPYSAEALAFPRGRPTSEGEEEKGTSKSYYGLPERLTSASMCATPPNTSRPAISLDNMTATIETGKEQVTVSMCAVADERTYGTTDWVMISLPRIHEETKKINSEEIQSIIDDDTLSNNSYTVAQLQYLTLSVQVSEVMSSLLAGSAANGYVDILLDGDNAPRPKRGEEETWMYPESSSSSDDSDAYLPWGIYASSLSYRRIAHRTNANTSETEPFNFAFIPGSLLHSASSIRVPMIIRAAVKFVTYAFTAANSTHSSQRVKKNEREEALLYIVSVSRGISAALRFDTDAYNPVISQSGIAPKRATAILIVLIVAVVCVLAASVYVEVTYKRIIHDAKYHPKGSDSPVGVRYGRHGKPKESRKTAKEGSRTEGGVGFSASKARMASGAAMGDATAASVKTKFGTVLGEQERVQESVTGSRSASSEAGGAGDVFSIENPPIGEEQPRVEDDEVAEF
ncbi:hypothetical protein GH5_02974 [Leishmania sp. Ghana 2012 LV757]|uniref:hypothetical protein n=1 Tax=Leishmania sp. Ghana 2012 LV757 TaxID=2803181 RepID=UPI001B46F2A4|nr:hypothetical protein GH5_02974 [Leishmania sp. Ghana 2012 LV757]